MQTAAFAVISGSARAVACVFADTPLRDGVPAGSAFARQDSEHSQDRDKGGPTPEGIGFAGLAAGYGFRSVTAYYALAARRHMQQFGTTSEQLGAVAVAQRQWAAGNPLANELCGFQRGRRIVAARDNQGGHRDPGNGFSLIHVANRLATARVALRRRCQQHGAHPLKRYWSRVKGA